MIWSLVCFAAGALTALGIEHRAAIYTWYLTLRTNGVGL